VKNSENPRKEVALRKANEQYSSDIRVQGIKCELHLPRGGASALTQE
jgi:hypothetical protein